MNTLFKIFLLFGVAWSHAKAGEITSLSKNLSDSKISNIKITALDDMPDYVTFSYCSTPPGENSPIPVYLSGGKAASLTSASEISKGNSCSLLYGGRAFHRSNLRELESIVTMGQRRTFWMKWVGYFAAAIPIARGLGVVNKVTQTSAPKIVQLVSYGSRRGRKYLTIIGEKLSHALVRYPKLQQGFNKYIFSPTGSKATKFISQMVFYGLSSHFLVENAEDFYTAVSGALQQETWNQLKAFTNQINNRNETDDQAFDRDLKEIFDSFINEDLTSTIANKLEINESTYRDHEKISKLITDRHETSILNPLEQEQYYNAIAVLKDKLEVSTVFQTQNSFITNIPGDEIVKNLNTIINYSGYTFEENYGPGALTLNGEWSLLGQILPENLSDRSISDRLNFLGHKSGKMVNIPLGFHIDELRQLYDEGPRALRYISDLDHLRPVREAQSSLAPNGFTLSDLGQIQEMPKRGKEQEYESPHGYNRSFIRNKLRGEIIREINQCAGVRTQVIRTDFKILQPIANTVDHLWGGCDFMYEDCFVLDDAYYQELHLIRLNLHLDNGLMIPFVGKMATYLSKTNSYLSFSDFTRRDSWRELGRLEKEFLENQEQNLADIEIIVDSFKGKNYKFSFDNM